ncbi:MAG: ImmA/IrrE family metallo-endopeptidase [Blastocatellia bacterium]
MPRNGCYTVIRGYPCIALDEKLSPTELLITAWHEMGHHFLHAPDLHLYGHPNKSKAEYQAHVISACALIPQQVIRRHTFADIEEAYNLPHDLVLFRARVWQTLRMEKRLSS